MEQNDFSTLLAQFPQMYYQANFYLSWGDFVNLTGIPSTNLHKIISQIPDKPTITIKNRIYYRVDFIFRYHNWLKTKNN